MPACRAEETVRALLMSLVNTPAARPYCVSLALRMTSLMLRKHMICCTGPKIWDSMAEIFNRKHTNSEQRGRVKMQIMLWVPLLWQCAYRLWHSRRPWVGWKAPAGSTQTHHTPTWHLPPSRFLLAPLSYQTASGQSGGSSSTYILSTLSLTYSTKSNKQGYLWSLIHPR